MRKLNILVAAWGGGLIFAGFDASPFVRSDVDEVVSVL